MSDEPVSLFLIGSFAEDQKFHFSFDQGPRGIIHDVNGYNLP